MARFFQDNLRIFERDDVLLFAQLVCLNGNLGTLEADPSRTIEFPASAASRLQCAEYG